MINIKNYILDAIKNYNTTATIPIDTRNGGNVQDILVNPLSSILQPYNSAHQYILDTLSISDPMVMSNSQMDSIAGKFLITRNSGCKSSGQIYLIFSEPAGLTITAGTL